MYYLDEDFLNVLLVCTRAEALTTCLELTNTPVYGNIMYVSAKDSMVTEFKEIQQFIVLSANTTPFLPNCLIFNRMKLERQLIARTKDFLRNPVLE